MSIFNLSEHAEPYARTAAGLTASPQRDLTVTPRPRRFIDQLLDDVREQIQPDQAVVDEAIKRRELVTGAARRLGGISSCFASGSLAHGTAICPIHRHDHGLDGDGGAILDPRAWPLLGPESAFKLGPEQVMEVYREAVQANLRVSGYPQATAEITKRAILVRFHSPLPGGEDPTVDLVLGLPRTDGGLWIPNTVQHRWDASDPQEHTRLFNGPMGPTVITVLRARTVRLAKAENKRTDPPPMCSFNVEALALPLLQYGAAALPEALLMLWRGGAVDLRRGPTADPAGVSGPIKIKDRLAVATGWDANADRVEQALEPGTSDVDVRGLLHPLWPDYIAEDNQQASKARLAAGLRTNLPLFAAPAGGISVQAMGSPLKVTRAYGQN